MPCRKYPQYIGSSSSLKSLPIHLPLLSPPPLHSRIGILNGTLLLTQCKKHVVVAITFYIIKWAIAVLTDDTATDAYVVCVHHKIDQMHGTLNLHRSLMDTADICVTRLPSTTILVMTINPMLASIRNYGPLWWKTWLYDNHGSWYLINFALEDIQIWNKSVVIKEHIKTQLHTKKQFQTNIILELLKRNIDTSLKGPVLLTWFNFNPKMYKMTIIINHGIKLLIHPENLRMDDYFHPTLYRAYPYYLSMLW